MSREQDETYLRLLAEMLRQGHRVPEEVLRLTI
jgi:hypothetical protein